MNKPSFKRYIWLINTIYQSGEEGITFENLNGKWKESELSKGKAYPLRTFHNHRKEIKDVFNINIRCRKSSNSYYIADGQKSNWLMRKILDLITVNQMLEEHAEMADVLAFETRQGGECYLSELLTAIGQRKTVDIEYKPSGSESVVHHNGFEPYALKEFDGAWFLVGHHKVKGDEIVDLRQVLSLQVNEEEFIYPVKEVVQKLLVDTYGTSVETIPTEEVTLKVTAALSKELRDNPLHASQMEMEKRKNYSIFYLNVKPTTDLCRKILSFGSSIEVLAPLSMRGNMVKIAKQVMRKNS